jgi:hypothetical protein
VLPSNALQRGSQRTQLLLLCVRWNVYAESLPSNGSICHNIIREIKLRETRGAGHVACPYYRLVGAPEAAGFCKGRNE